MTITASYFTLKGVRHGACNAHHLRELQGPDRDREGRLGQGACIACSDAPTGPPASPIRTTATCPPPWVARISRAWDQILDRAVAFHEAQPTLQTGKRGRRKRRIGHNLALRLQKNKEGCLRFLTDPRIPFTNNEAERDLRMAKLRQKISGGFRSLQGACDFAILRAVIATARKQGWNVLETLAHPDPMQLMPQLRF